MEDSKTLYYNDCENSPEITNEEKKFLEELMKDYFFTELLKRKSDEDSANEMANKLTINVESFEANIDID